MSTPLTVPAVGFPPTELRRVMRLLVQHKVTVDLITATTPLRGIMLVHPEYGLNLIGKKRGPYDAIVFWVQRPEAVPTGLWSYCDDYVTPMNLAERLPALFSCEYLIAMRRMASYGPMRCRIEPLQRKVKKQDWEGVSRYVMRADPKLASHLIGCEFCQREFFREIFGVDPREA